VAKVLFRIELLKTKLEPVEDPIEMLEYSTPNSKETAWLEDYEDVSVEEMVRCPRPIQGLSAESLETDTVVVLPP